MASKRKNTEHIFTRLPEDTYITKLIQHEHSLELVVSYPEPNSKDVTCGHCAGTHCVSKDSGKYQTIRHINISGQGSLVTFHKPRFLCKECGRSFYFKPDWVCPNTCISEALRLEIIKLLTSTTHSIAEIARETFTTPYIVRSVMLNCEVDTPCALPETLCIDEFHGETGKWNKRKKRFKTNKYHCNISNADSGRVLDILPKSDYQTLRSYFKKFSSEERQKVKFFCCDMRPGFSKVAKNLFPKATICIDPFHVIQLLSKCMDTVRNLELNRLKDLNDSEGLKLLNRTKTLLLTSPFNQHLYWKENYTKKSKRIEQICKRFKDIDLIYSALQEFHILFRQNDFRLQRFFLNEWIRNYESVESPQLRTAVSTIKQFKEVILNAWRFGKSNALCESLNKRIKDVKRASYGAHKFVNFRLRSLLACGNLSFIRSTYTIFSEKSSSTKIYSHKVSRSA